ncbi:regulatory protein ArsR [Kribbella flavida DSM 17836]|uniref:Regulatory protein ArsR n=1 Tax=Kribbella flavida (strain DSM 17836 / JCM 10339 / NBRC 14399) TaxID=479435 RepID=D2PM41_KRIFD|nr:winged helix-turn-helix domain-containing protein [Kribbella flavida]ADB34409.1 regulatory protein ArsR [Kribbella flavida DSM 17836]
MLRIHFTSQDLARTTVAEEPDPLWEVLLSLHQLQVQDGWSHYGHWRESTRRQLPKQVAQLLQLTPPRGYSPDFLTPAHPGKTFEEGVEQVLSTSRRRFQQELELLSVRRTGSGWIRELVNGHGDVVKGLGQTLHVYHRHGIAPYWDSLRSLVRADHQQKVGHLAAAGVDHLLGHLHPAVRWEAPVLKVDGLPDQDLHLEGRGLRLQPSVFCWRKPTKLRDPLLQPVLVYPVQHGPGALHRRSAGGQSRPLAALLGQTRAAALEAIANSCTTTELAQRCQISLAGASRQAGVLRDAGLITTRRAGQAVRHDLTALGRMVLEGRASGQSL